MTKDDKIVHRYSITVEEFNYMLFVGGYDLLDIYREQYELAKKGISLSDSSKMAEFEREAYISFILEDKKNEVEQIKATYGLK